MKQLIFFSLFLFPSLLFAQETVKKTNDNGKNKEVFYVLKSDKKIKQGPYQKFNFAGQLVAEGFYKNGEKDSVWTEYWAAPRVKALGSYANGKRIGIWQFFSTTGDLQQEYDFTDSVLIADETLQSSKSKTFKLIQGTDTIETTLDRPPVYIGGKACMQSTLIKGITYPREMFSVRENIVGDVEIEFVVTKDGMAQDFKIIKGVGHGLDEEVLRLSKQISSGWIPAIYKGETVSVVTGATVNFRMFAAKTN